MLRTPLLVRRVAPSDPRRGRRVKYWRPTRTRDRGDDDAWRLTREEEECFAGDDDDDAIAEEEESGVLRPKGEEAVRNDKA